jgi:glycosyltransferase involved in cell wall biosynthesis
MRARRYDLIHTHFFLPSGVVAYALHQMTGVPYVVTAHGSDVPGYNPDRFRGTHRILAPAWQRIASSARAITCPSRWLADLIAEVARDTLPIHIIPNGISQEWITPEEKQPDILVVSRLFERKGVQFLLQALQQGPLNHVVHIVGDGPYRPRLEKLARDVPDRVVFHGWLENHSPELKRLYASASVFVFPSLAENFPISLLEAMLAGDAIVASDLPACHEVLGDAALYARAGDVESLRKQLLGLVKDSELRDRYASLARRRVLEDFVWPRIGTQYHELFTALAASPHSVLLE